MGNWTPKQADPKGTSGVTNICAHMSSSQVEQLVCPMGLAALGQLSLTRRTKALSFTTLLPHATISRD